jgi:hypothetical protein
MRRAAGDALRNGPKKSAHFHFVSYLSLLFLPGVALAFVQAMCTHRTNFMAFAYGAASSTTIAITIHHLPQ